jgi:2'-hydroxyisoflavone reductase
MKLLFVGGTSFVGRHAVEAAVAAGHDVTVFHRGRTNDDLLAGAISHRHGDRSTGDYSALADGTSWDAVIDVSAYVPRNVEQLADAVGGRAGHYVHISSISAYEDDSITTSEDSPLHADLADPTVEDVTNETYGPLKAMCERAGRRRFGEEHTAVIRPTYVAGPHDSTDRFTYWARRMARGGDVAVIGTGAPLQIVDARDLGEFAVRCAETRAAGAFDGVGPWAPVEEFLAEITPAGVEARLIDIGAEALAAAESSLPLMAGTSLPLLSGEPDAVAFMSRPGEQARAHGLRTRPLAETAEVTREWDIARGTPALRVGPSPEAEAELLRQCGAGGAISV